MDSFSAVRFPFRGFFFSSCFSPSKSVHSSCPHVGSTCVKEPSKFRSSDPQFSSFARSDGGTSKPVVHRVGQTFQEKRTRKRTGSSSLCPRPTPQTSFSTQIPSLGEKGCRRSWFSGFYCGRIFGEEWGGGAGLPRRGQRRAGVMGGRGRGEEKGGGNFFTLGSSVPAPSDRGRRANKR